MSPRDLLKSRSGPLGLLHDLSLLAVRPLPPSSNHGLAHRLRVSYYLHPIHPPFTCTPLRCVNNDGGIFLLARSPQPWATAARLRKALVRPPSALVCRKRRATWEHWNRR